MSKASTSEGADGVRSPTGRACLSLQRVRAGSPHLEALPPDPPMGQGMLMTGGPPVNVIFPQCKLLHHLAF